jgi:hypothetical protein
VACGRAEERGSYRKGVAVRYIGRDLLCLAARPALLPQALLDSLNARVRSDFDWRDLPGSLGLVRRGVWQFQEAWRNGQITAEAPVSTPAGSRRSGVRRALRRLTPWLVAQSLLLAQTLYHTGKSQDGAWLDAARHSIPRCGPPTAEKGQRPRVSAAR